MLGAPAVAVAGQEFVEAFLERGGVQLGGTGDHAFGVAVGERIDSGRQQFPGFIGLGAGLGERYHPRTAEPNDPLAVVDLVSEQPRLADDALAHPGNAIELVTVFRLLAILPP